MKSKTIKGMKGDYTAVKKQVSAEFTKAKAKISDAQKHAESHIAKNPKKAVAIAAGVGAVIGAAVTAYLMNKKSVEKKSAEKK